MADPVTLAALLRSGQAGAPVPTMGQDPQQAAVTLAALARAGLLSGEGGPAPGGLPTANDLLSNFTPAPSSMPPPTPAPARMPTAEQMLGSFMPAQGGPPSAYDQPSYRPTSGMALGPQSAQEEEDIQAEKESAFNLGQFGASLAAGPVIGGAGRGIAALMSQFPRAAAAGTAGVALTGQSTAAGPPKQRNAPGVSAPSTPGVDPHLQRLLESDPVLRQLQTQLDEQERIANDQSKYKSVRDGARTRAADIQTKFNERLGELSRANLPFDQAYPWLAQNRAVVALGAPALMGYAARTGMNLLSRIGPARWERALERADRALERGNDRAYEHYMARAARLEPRELGRMSQIAHEFTPPVAGGAMGLELALLPYQHNATNAPLGSPQRKEAEDMLGDPWRWGPRAALGAGVGAVGGFGAGHLPNIGPGFRPPPAGPIAPIPPPPTGGPTPAAPLPSQTARPLPQSPQQPGGPGSPPPGQPPGAIWPAPPAVYNPPPAARGPGPGPGQPPGGGAPNSLLQQWAPQPNVTFGQSPSRFQMGPTRIEPSPPPTPPPTPPQRILPPSAGGPPHQPGVTQYRNPATGEVRSLDRRGRWQGRHPNGRNGWISEPPSSWERVSSAEGAGQTMAEFLRG